MAGSSLRRPVTLRLTHAEARQLFLSAEAGYGDGDFYEHSPNGPEERAYLRAQAKLRSLVFPAPR